MAAARRSVELMVAETSVKLPSIGLSYNAEIRNNGTARRVQDALVWMGAKEAGMVRYNRPPYDGLNEHDFHLYIDDGRDDIEMAEYPSPNACWLVDTHLGYEQRLAWAKKFDHVFVAQLPTVDKLQEDGVENVHWLPLACSPNLDMTAAEMRQADIMAEPPSKEWDVCFVGFLNTGVNGHGHNRMEYLNSVFGEFPNSWLAFNRFFHEAAMRFVKARVGFNISILDDLNMRFFEIMSYGVCQVTNTDVIGIEELGFNDREHFIGYDGEEEAIEAVRWAVENPLEAERIAKAGHELVREKHTYKHRIEQLLTTVGVM